MPYDPSPLNEVLNLSDGYFLVDPDEVGHLTSAVGQETTCNVVFFPSNTEQNPSRWIYKGILLSFVVNERKTKGRFVFSDGTVLLLQTSLLTA